MPMQDSLPAGWLTFAERELNPLGRDERFPNCYVSSPFPGFSLTRREFIALVGGAAAWPHYQALAQQPERMPRIAVLVDNQSPTYTFLQTLKELGWTEGRNIRIDLRMDWDNPLMIKDGAIEFVALKPDLIVVKDTPGAKAVLEQTYTKPIVFVACADPVGDGLVDSFARPGGNVTGFSSFEPGMGGKWVELLKEMAPHVTRIAVIVHPHEPKASLAEFLRTTETAAQSLGVALAIVPDTRSVSDAIAVLLRAIGGMAQEANSGFIVFPGTYTNALYHYQALMLAKRYRLPAIYPSKSYVSTGGLMSYGVDLADNFRRAASYVDRILRGTKPNELPVQAPIKFELAVNLSTARDLGLTVPQSILLRADEVIE